MRAVLVVLSFCFASFAQTATSQSVLFTALAADSSMPAITQEDIEVTGVRAVRSLEKLDDVPLSIIFVNDESNSARHVLTIQVRAVKSCITQLIRPETDHGLMMAFDAMPEIRTGWESSDKKLKYAAERARPGGGSAPIGALSIAANTFLTAPGTGSPRVILLFSDGGDNQSMVAREEALIALQSVGARVYAFLPDNYSDPRGKSLLSFFAKGTGGRVFSIHTGKGSEEKNALLCRALEPELRNWYRLTFSTDPAAKERRQQQLSIRPKRPEVSVRAPSAYILPSTP